MSPAFTTRRRAEEFDRLVETARRGSPVTVDSQIHPVCRGAGGGPDRTEHRQVNEGRRRLP